MNRHISIIVCCVLGIGSLASRLPAENPQVQDPVEKRGALADQDSSRIARLASSEFAVRRGAFLELWRSGTSALPLISQAKSSSERQVVEAASILEILIELKIAPEKQDASGRLLDVITNPTALAIIELCEMKFWNVAERMLEGNHTLAQKFQEPYGRYLLSRVVDVGVDQGNPALAWPIVRQVTPPALKVWIAHKTDLDLEPIQGPDNYSRALELYYAGDLDAALSVNAPAIVRVPMVTRMGRWSSLLDEPIRLALCGRQQTPAQAAVNAVLHEVAGKLPESRELWNQLLATQNVPSEAELENADDPDSESALRILMELGDDGAGGQTTRNQFLAALLFSGRTDPIERYLLQENPSSAFDFFLAGNNPAKAFEAVGLSADLSNFDTWLAQRKALIMVELGQRAANSLHFHLCARVCGTLSGMGYRDEAQELLDELVGLARLSRGKREELWSRSLLGWLGRSEARELAMQAARSEFHSMSTECQAGVLKGLFPQFDDSAHALWKTAPGDNSDEKWLNLERLYLFDRGHFGNASQTILSGWLRRAAEGSSPGQLTSEHLRALGEIAMGLGDSDLALELLTTDLSAQFAGASPINIQWLDAARIYVQLGKPQEALPLFSAVRKNGSNIQRAYVDEVQALLLCGQFEQAGRLEQSRWLRPLATTRFYQGYNYLQATSEFTEDNQFARAAEYAQAAFLLADSGSMDVHWAASEYAHVLEELGDFVRCADVQRAALVEALQPYASSMQYLVSNGYFSSLRLAAQKERLSRAVVGIEAGNLAGARHSIEVGRQLQPQDIEMVVQCYPRLMKAGETEMAEEVFSVYERNMLAQISSWPKDATALNNLAWMYSQCDRQLDEAMELVRQAVELAPSSAIFLDTLAEIQYRSGQVDSALETMRKCVRLDPRESHYRQNLVRFRNGEK